MCGIAGALSIQDCRPVVDRLAESIIHRGPDDGGFADLRGRDGVVRGRFANRRLAILDLSMAGHQPMWSADRRFCLSYNGEIYNFRELRTELEREGARIQSTGDTAVILEGWARWGTRVLARLRGMFAISMWDSETERCYLARDVFGIKPLYISDSDGMVLFASEIRALLNSGKVPRTLSTDAVRSYLETGSVSEPATIIESISAVPAGNVLTIDCRSSTPLVGDPVEFDNPFGSVTDDDHSVHGTPAGLRQVLRDSVSHHMVSDVPIALFLSGGIDSSSVVGLASEVSETVLDTFTITFDDPRYSEADAARAVAKQFRTRHHEIPLTGKQLLDALPDAFSAMDQPSLDGLNTYSVSGAVRGSGIKVVLSGLGGDELFAGYPSFRRAGIAAPLWKFRGGAQQLLAGASAFSKDPRLERLRGLFDDASPARGAYRASRTLFDPRQIRDLMSELTGSRQQRKKILSPHANRDLSVLQQVSFYETTGYMRNTLLRDSDVFSMAHSLEMRVPFVDREVVRAAMSFPDSQKLSRGWSKPVLIDAVRDLLPNSLLRRPKQGFTLPFERWMRSEMFEEVDSVLASSDLTHVGLSRNAVRSIWADFQHRRGGTNWSRPWALYTLKRWADQNGVTIDAAIPVDRPALRAGVR